MRWTTYPSGGWVGPSTTLQAFSRAHSIEMSECAERLDI